MSFVIFGRGFSAWISDSSIWQPRPQTWGGETLISLGRLRLTTWREKDILPL